MLVEHRRMTRLFAFVALLAACTLASPQGIYKWTDSSGHVHYGDRNDAPQGNAGTTLNIQGRATRVEPPAAGESKATATSLPESSNLQRCLGLARAMADSRDTTPAVVRAQSQELLSLCPDTAYECSSYPRQPDRNNCQAVRMQTGGHIMTNRTYN